jgi:hypothetical protein
MTIAHLAPSFVRPPEQKCLPMLIHEARVLSQILRQMLDSSQANFYCAVSPSGQEAFPPLPQAAPAARQPPPSGLQARPFINPLAAKAPAKGKISKAPAAKVGPQVQYWLPASKAVHKGLMLAISTKTEQTQGCHALTLPAASTLADYCTASSLSDLIAV